MEEGADRRHGVVDLVVDDPDRLLPDPDLLAAQLRRQALEQDQPVRLRVDPEDALADVEGLLRVR
jgi:hypothetical protein